MHMRPGAAALLFAFVVVPVPVTGLPIGPDRYCCITSSANPLPSQGGGRNADAGIADSSEINTESGQVFHCSFFSLLTHTLQ